MDVQIIRINRVESNPIGPDYRYKLNEEWIEIKNTEYSSQQLSGWKIWQKTYPSEKFSKAYEFGSFILGGYSLVKVHTGSGTNTQSDLYIGSGNFIWNNTGDEAHLDDNTGKTVSRMTVPPIDR